MKNAVSWRPYIAGALVGVLAIVSVFASTKILGKAQYLGASTTFVRAAGFIEERLAPEHVKNNAYFAKEKVKIDWQFMLVVGVFIGALAAALADGASRWRPCRRSGASVLETARGSVPSALFWGVRWPCSAPAWRMGARAGTA